jgi:hypothetical protein
MAWLDIEKRRESGRRWYHKKRATDQAFVIRERKRKRDAVNEKNALLKEAVVNVYTNGEGTCRWCGQGDMDVLCLDHVNDDGARFRQKDRTNHSGSLLYKWIIRNDYPPIFQVLCASCNMKKEVMRRRACRLTQ